MRPMPSLNPAQQATLDLLGATPGTRPTFDADLRAQLETDLVDGLEPLLGYLPDGETLYVNKHDLNQALGCEARFVADHEQPFEWTPAMARGVVAHKAIELSVHWRGDTSPLGLVDEALARLEGDESGLGQWLRGISEGDRAELRSEANNRVAAFIECFPPLETRWRPLTESRVRSELFDGHMVLSGKVDLSLGRSDGLTAGKVLIDLKTGGSIASHRDDLRFYALLETLRIGTPPRRLASYYLDQGRAIAEDVTVPMLDSVLVRVTTAIERIVELLHCRRPPRTQPGPACRWCRLAAECPDALGADSDAEDSYPDEL